MNESIEVPMTVIKNEVGKTIVKLDLNDIDELPKISIVTPMYNRYHFVKLMIRNFKKIYYERHLLEWIIVDDSDKIMTRTDLQNLDDLNNFIKDNNKKIKFEQIKYFKLNEHVTIGSKRNILGSYCKNEYIVHMDDDDYYPDVSVMSRIRTLISTNKKVCGCSKVNCYDIMSDVSFESFDPDVNGNPKTISESTLAYKRSFFLEKSFDNSSKFAECLPFLEGRYKELVTIPSSFVIMQLTHDSNTINRRISVINNDRGPTNFFKSLNAADESIITGIKASILFKDPLYKKILDLLKKDPVKFFKEYDDPKCSDPDRIKILSNPLIIDHRSLNDTILKKGQSKGTIAYYCGPGSYFKFKNEWCPESKILGGSEESVIKLSNEFSRENYKVIVYCVLDENFNKKYFRHNYNGVIYRPYWEWYHNKYHDITIVWRDPTILTTKINSKKIFLDLHDDLRDSFLFNNLKNDFEIMCKSDYHKDSIKNIINDKYKIHNIPNGIISYKERPKESSNDKIVLCSTSSPDRCLMALLYMLPIIREKFPNVILKWAYGFSAGINKGGLESDERPVVKQFVTSLKEKMNNTEGFVNLGRLSQSEIDELYMTSDYYVYGTLFNEIDCISYTKAVSAGCIPIVVGPAALSSKNKLLSLENYDDLFEESVEERIDTSLKKDTELFNKFVEKFINKNLIDNSSFKKIIDEEYNIGNVSKKWIDLFIHEN